MVRTGRSARRAAARAAARLAHLPDVHGVLLFGSVARQRCDRDSDIDLLVVGTHPGHTSRGLWDTLPAGLRRRRVSVQYVTDAGLARLFAEGPSFTEHLRREGVVLYDRDGRLRRTLRAPAQHTVSIDDEIALHMGRLRPLTHWEQYNGNFLACLANLYATAKAVVILGLLRSGVAEFDHRTIFDVYRARYPERAADVDTVARLGPFARMLAGRHSDLPFSYRDAEGQARAAAAAIRRLAAP